MEAILALNVIRNTLYVSIASTFAITVTRKYSDISALANRCPLVIIGKYVIIFNVKHKLVKINTHVHITLIVKL